MIHNTPKGVLRAFWRRRRVMEYCISTITWPELITTLSYCTDFNRIAMFRSLSKLQLTWSHLNNLLRSHWRSQRRGHWRSLRTYGNKPINIGKLYWIWKSVSDHLKILFWLHLFQCVTLCQYTMTSLLGCIVVFGSQTRCNWKGGWNLLFQTCIKLLKLVKYEKNEWNDDEIEKKISQLLATAKQTLMSISLAFVVLYEPGSHYVQHV